MSDEKMDEAVVSEKLNAALALQQRSALQYMAAAGSLRGPAYQGLAMALAEWSQDELRGAQALVEKITAVGGEVTAQPAKVPFERDPDATVQALIASEREAMAALHAVIPETGQEPRSEALEHMLEHVIMNKQQHLDALERAAG